jgi:hypothetical protein
MHQFNFCVKRASQNNYNNELIPSTLDGHYKEYLYEIMCSYETRNDEKTQTTSLNKQLLMNRDKVLCKICIEKYSY